MPVARFLSNDNLWHEIRRRAARAKNVRAAVAYFGTGGADLLPLKKGDTLLVDMSLAAVRQGATNPKEIRRLMRRGVRVFTRASLHAKFFLMGRCLIACSANVSQNSLRSLDEAGILTSDPAALRRADDFFNLLCTEPVRSQYLKECIQAYKPPIFKALTTQRARRLRRTPQAKVWFIGGLRYASVPAKEEEQLKQAKSKAARRSRCSVDRVEEIFYPAKERYFSSLRPGQDWLVSCARDADKGRSYVDAPARLLAVDSYSRGRGKRRWLLLTEEAANAERMPLRSFRARVRKVVPQLDRESPRTRAIEDEEHADSILRLWTPSGKAAKRR